MGYALSGAMTALVAMSMFVSPLQLAAQNSDLAPLAPAALASATDAAASPSDANAASPLRTIGRVHATTAFCKALVQHASAAVDHALDNDVKLIFVEQTLKTTDFDSNALKKASGSHRVLEEYVALRASAVAGQGEMRELREEAKNAPTPEQRAELGRFADALDGALSRQKKLADALGRFVAYLDSHDPISNDDHDRMVFDAIAAQNSAGSGYTDAFGTQLRRPVDLRDHGDPRDDVPDQLSTTAAYASKELAHRAEPIAKDEDDAADRIDAAFSGC